MENIGLEPIRLTTCKVVPGAHAHPPFVWLPLEDSNLASFQSLRINSARPSPSQPNGNNSFVNVLWGDAWASIPYLPSSQPGALPVKLPPTQKTLLIVEE